VFPLLRTEERDGIERTIMQIPALLGRRDSTTNRDRLLGCLRFEDLATDDAKRLWEELNTTKAFPANKPPVRFSGVFSKEFGEVEFLAEQGVPVNAEPNRRIRELESPVKAFATSHRNSAPSEEQIADAFPAIRLLHEALQRADVDGVHTEQRDHALDTLAEALGVAAAAESFSCTTPEGALALGVLLQCVEHPDPESVKEPSSQFEDHPSWGTPAVRITATQALLTLLHDESCATAPALAAVEKLAEDSVAAVRYQLASRLAALRRSAPDLMWRLAGQLAEHETSRGVLQGLLGWPLSRLAGAHPNRVAQLAEKVFQRILEGPGAERVRDHCIDIFTGLHVWQDEPTCGRLIADIVAHTHDRPAEAAHIPYRLREALTATSPGPLNGGADVRGRAIQLLLSVLRAARGALGSLQEKHALPFSGWPSVAQEQAKSHMRLVDQIGGEVYFASGSFKDGEPDHPKLTNEQRERFYREASDVLDELTTSGFAGVAHHLIETLETYVPMDPEAVFLRIASIVRSSETKGYQYESLGADLIVRIVERYLAEFRHILRTSEACRLALVDVLDVFLRAGWPAA
jgi:hypothetical protein